MNPNQTEAYIDQDLALKQYQLKYERVSSDYNSLQTKILTLLAVELTITTFIFLQGPIVPHQYYGKVFFWAGTIGVFASILVSMLSAHSNKWMSPPGKKTLSEKTRQKFRGYDFVDLLLDDYREAYDYCLGKFTERSAWFDWSLRIFALSSITLLVIKYGLTK